MEERLNPKERVYKNIEKKILSREWIPGTKITSENQLAKDLGVSRMSVREAIEKLVALNVVSKKQGEGTFVNELGPSMYFNTLVHMTLLDKDNLIDLLEFRRIIEVESVTLFTKRCKDEDIKFLEQCYSDMQKYKNEPDKFYKTDYDFHMIIAKGTNNSLIIKINSIMTDLLMFHQKEIHDYLGPQGGLVEHKQILDAIKSRDFEMASLFMQRHIERTLNQIIDIMLNDRGTKCN